MMKHYTEDWIEVGPYINWMKLQWIPKHKIHYLEFGSPNAPVIVCAHGLTRNAHDFYKIAATLGKKYRVISISYPGRGESEYFKNKNHYNYYVYAEDTVRLMKKLYIKNAIWLGTSMGGMIGMLVGAYKRKLLTGLILNDIGPAVPISTIKKLNECAKQDVSCNNLAEAKQTLKEIYHDFGINEEAAWDHLTKYSFTKRGNKYVMTYDPALTQGIDSYIHGNKKYLEAWWVWDRLKCKILVIHGENSDILIPEVLKKMKSKKEFDLFTVKNIGHAPALIEDDQIMVIKDWIDGILQPKEDIKNNIHKDS